MLITLSTWTILGKNEVDTPQCGIWSQGKGMESPEHEDITIPMTLRRRLTPLGKLAMGELFRVDAQLSEANQETPWVMACRHGDTSRMLNLLTSLAQKEQLSPMDFSLSVHNAIGGMFSIAMGNKQSSTSLSGGKNTFEMGLVEAYALAQARQMTIGYLYYDMPLPVFYGDHPNEEELGRCVSIILSPDDDFWELGKNQIRLTFTSHKEEASSKSITSANIMALIDFLQNKATDLALSIPGGTFLFEKNEFEKNG